MILPSLLLLEAAHYHAASEQNNVQTKPCYTISKKSCNLGLIFMSLPLSKDISTKSLAFESFRPMQQRNQLMVRVTLGFVANLWHFPYVDMQTVTVLILFFTLALIYCFQKLLAYRSAIHSVQYVKKTNEATLTESWHPFVRNISGYRVLLSPTSALGLILPGIPVICRGNNHFFKDKHTRTLICTVER